MTTWIIWMMLIWNLIIMCICHQILLVVECGAVIMSPMVFVLQEGWGNLLFFIMMTCNLKWPELCSNTILQSDWNITVLDIPLIAICTFKFCLSHLFQDLNTLFGSMKYRVHVIRFQKRGLPHAHITIKFSDTYIHPHEIDLAISAQLPVDCNNLLLVKQFMIHKHKGPGGYPSNTNGCHLKDGTCRYEFPKPLASTTHINPTMGCVIYHHLNEANQWVVPHNIHLLWHHQCHINCEIAGTVSLFQYLYKYLYKDIDYANCFFT